ncbi:hypothetical protein L9F63_000066, partial [Diploptera punctata]
VCKTINDHTRPTLILYLYTQSIYLLGVLIREMYDPTIVGWYMISISVLQSLYWFSQIGVQLISVVTKDDLAKSSAIMNIKLTKLVFYR